MATSCAFSSGFSRGFAVCVDEPVMIAVGAPIAPTRKRKKKPCAAIRGEGWIVVIGIGRAETYPSKAALALEEMRELQGEGDFLGAVAAIEPYRHQFPHAYDEAIVLWMALEAFPELLQPTGVQEARAEEQRLQAEQQRQTRMLHNGYLPSGKRGYRSLMCSTCESQQLFHGAWARRSAGKWHCTECGYPEDR